MKNRFLCSAIMLFCSILLSCQSKGDDRQIVVHAHRGGAAILPENTIEAMIEAINLGVPVLELDLHISSDSLVIVSHDAYFNRKIATTPQGGEIPIGEEENYKLFLMPYDSIRKYDVGVRANPRYPHRKNRPCQIPLVSVLIDSVESYCRIYDYEPVSYNIEIKSDPTKDHVFTPDYKTFADLCMADLLSKNLNDRLLIQCFDVRTLNYLHEKYPDVQLSYLVEDTISSFSQIMSLLTFVPKVFSPYYPILTPSVVKQAKEMGMELAPWTVDHKAEVLRLKKLDVDAIISNQPDSVMIWLRES